MSALTISSDLGTYIAYEALPQGVSGNVSLEVFGPRIPLQTVGTLVQAGVGGMTPRGCGRTCAPMDARTSY